MKIAIMQPTFLPWLGYFYMINSVDKFVFLDSVQFERRSWQSRNKIKLNDREFTISLSTQKTAQTTKISDIKLLSEDKWRKKILNTIYHAYKKSVNFDYYFQILSSAIMQCESLADLNISLITKFMQDLDIKTPIYKSSQLSQSNAKREELLLRICQDLKAASYLSSQGSKSYLQTKHSMDIFANSKIDIEYLNFTHPAYNQKGKNFIPYLGIIDFLFNETSPKESFNKIILEQNSNNMGGGRANLPNPSVIKAQNHIPILLDKFNFINY
ncbi:WbqC family protein [Campylobacter sp. CX2-8023-23]|uniref:WbqC family protein n=1 Tax=Campylobacter porcelli TaxID=1660073 RepID=UPI002EA6CFFE|nr:WbqC family protein [Campylobacter sp. CX2-8023-23]MEE3776320.1 WbqC family protein [Campylobacter sp. CX2-4080-23]